MPNGKIHDKITSIILLPLILVLILLSLSTYNIILIIIGFIFSSFMFNGDLDIISKPYKRWLFLRIYWKPYQKLFSHRSIFTHGILIGTIIRLFYCLPILLVIYFILNINLLSLNFLIFCVGIEIGNIIHTTSDKLF